jgi:hypothetical protein
MSNDKCNDLALLRKALNWIAGPNTGLSSEQMLFCVVDIDRTDHWGEYEIHVPLDPADFNRCLLLVGEIPEIRDDFPKIAALSPRWKLIIGNWNKLEECFVTEELE